MYDYTEFDAAFVAERNRQFRAQVERRVAGHLTEDEFKPLRLMNGLYLQLHAYMLRVAIPYGTINSRQMDKLAYIAEKWDKGYGHFTTRQNIQYNWPKLPDVPDMLDALAEVNMHAIQTSGNTIRNVTADHFAGAAADEVADPRPVAELLRQWSTDHPEFQFLPRKFKIAVTGAENDRAVIKAHDIGIQIVDRDGDIGYRIVVGGGLGRTPMIGKVLNDFVPQEDLLPYVEAIVSVWNLLGRRDNKYKARIKITVHEHGIEDIRARVEERFKAIRPAFTGIDVQLFEEIKQAFAAPAFREDGTGVYETAYKTDPIFRAWADTNLAEHRAPGYAIVQISLKAHGATPGDASAEQMRVMAEIARKYGHDELRISHEQNVILPHVHKSDLPAIHATLKKHGLATANIGLISDIIRLPRHGLLRAGHGPVDPDRAGDRHPFRRAQARARDRRHEDQDLGLHQCLRPPPRGPYRHPRARSRGRRELPGHAGRRRARRTRPSARAPAPVSRPTRSSRRSSGSSMPISSCAKARKRPSCKPIAASEWSRSRRPFTRRPRPMPLNDLDENGRQPERALPPPLGDVRAGPRPARPRRR